MNKKHLDKESIEYLTKPINRFTFVSDDKTIKAIKDKVRYYSKTYGVPTDRYINISNTLLLSIIQKIQQSPKYASGKRKKSKSKPIGTTTSCISSICIEDCRALKAFKSIV